MFNVYPDQNQLSYFEWIACSKVKIIILTHSIVGFKIKINF